MYKLLDRELYLWQGILLYLLFLSIMLVAGFNLNNKFFEHDFDPLSKLDRQMVELQSKENKTAADYNKLGIVYFQKGALTEAKQAFIKAIALNNNYSDAYLNLGIAYFNEKNYSKAERYFQETLKKDATRDVAKFNLAKIYIEKGQFLDAEEMLKHVKSSYSTVADYYYYSALVYKHTKREKEAIISLETALKFDPEYEEAAGELKAIIKSIN